MRRKIILLVAMFLVMFLANSNIVFAKNADKAKLGKHILNIGDQSVVVNVVKSKGHYVVTCSDTNVDKTSADVENAIQSFANSLEKSQSETRKYCLKAIESANSLAEVRAAVELAPDVTEIKQKVLSVMKDLQMYNGGFSFIIPPDNDNIQGTYLALCIYNKLGLTPPNRDKIIRLIMSNKADNGGFFDTWHSQSLGITTYYAVSSINMLGLSLAPKVKTKVINYVSNMYNIEETPNGLFPLIEIAKNMGICLKKKPALIQKLKTKPELIQKRGIYKNYILPAMS